MQISALGANSGGAIEIVEMRGKLAAMAWKRARVAAVCMVEQKGCDGRSLPMMRRHAALRGTPISGGSSYPKTKSIQNRVLEPMSKRTNRLIASRPVCSALFIMMASR